jgi:hypothetical protein
MSPTAVPVRDCDEREEPLQREIEPELQQLLLKYPGKWAAITRSEILAIADDAATAVRKARESGHLVPILYHVPDASTLYFF